LNGGENDKFLIKLCLYILPVLYFIISFSQTSQHLFISLAPLGFCSGLLNTLINTKVSNEMKHENEIVGMCYLLKAIEDNIDLYQG
jgi:hypothetical protein